MLGRRAPTPRHQELSLDRIDFRRGGLPFANLADADLHYFVLSDAGLIGADLTGAVVKGARCELADLRR